MTRDATEQEMRALKEEIDARRRTARIVLVAVLVFMLMGLAVLWNMVTDEFHRIVAMGALVGVELVGLTFYNTFRAGWERLAIEDLKRGEVEVVKAPDGSGEEIAVFPGSKEVV